MKKILAILISLSIFLTFTACSETQENLSSDNSSDITESKPTPVLMENVKYVDKNGNEYSEVYSDYSGVPTAQSGDRLITADYEYLLSNKGWNVSTLDKTKTEYEAILTEINGKKVTSLNETFANCDKMTVSPEIPKTITEMTNAYVLCRSMKNAPKVPGNVKSMKGAFQQCFGLTSIPEIEEGVEDITLAFNYCTHILAVENLPDSIVIMKGAFQSCYNLTKVTDLPKNVQNMANAFNTCPKLETFIATIPKSVTNMTSTFRSCEMLNGNITVNATPEAYKSCFYMCGNIKIVGDSQNKTDLAATGSNITF